ncbi:hypothetical protein G0Q06_03110 [Puniceicoccales bacterium CK1056]|uniref:IPT/TIG domain-containing protein n=1 Tax=Oceanipulchritudo coccoides TaxID=2706888 RepID=A0A6B2LZ40_9BACT|nr:choice-of-anchor J domain-containing protein [Oceanipulchritudo coccoides]NDV61432.1 hypothetical protein [Oceanipulchritudo coccoides]
MKTSLKILGLALIGMVTIASQATAQPFLIASDNFDRADGSLTGSTPNPGPGSDWTSHSGTFGDLLVTSNQAVVQHGVPSEDTHVLFTAQSTGLLTATFDITVNDDAVIGGTDFEYFAHFMTEGSFNFRARVDVQAPADPLTGDYTLGIASGSSTAEATLTTDFSFNTPVSVTLEFNLDTGIASLTVGAETIVGTGVFLGENLDSFALRQSDSSNNETILVDNLEVYGDTAPPPPPEILIPELTPSVTGTDLDITFDTELDVFYRLKTSTILNGFADVPGQALIGTGSPATFTETIPLAGEKGFYRVEVLETAPAPEILGLSKVFAGVGETVTVTGNDLELASAVTINSTAAGFTQSGGALDVTVPVAAGTGFVDVTNLSGTSTSEFVVVTDVAGLVYQQEFTTGLDDFTIFDVAGSLTWTYNTAGVENYMEGNGFASDGPSDDWLISPAIDLSILQNCYLLLGHERRFSGPVLVVQVSTNYAGGDPTLATWTPLPVTLDTGTSTVTHSGAVDLSAFDGQSVHIAIQYTATAPGAGGGARDRIHYFAVGGDPVPPAF